MRQRDARTWLKEIDWFKNLTGEEIEKFLEISHLRDYHEHTHLFYEGDPLDRVFLLLSGKVKIYRFGEDGKEQIVNLLEEGDLFPHTGFFKRGGYPANAETLVPSHVLVMAVSDFEEVLLRYPGITMKLFQEMSERLMDLHARLEEKLLHDTREQILLLLLRLARNYGEPLSDGRRRLRTRFTNKELANMIGTTRETINRTLSQLRQEGLVLLSGDGYLIIDMEGLIHIL